MPLTLTDLVNHLNAPMPPDGDPAVGELQRALDTAIAEVTRMTGWLDDTTAIAQVPTGWERVLPLPYMRLAAIGAVTDPNGLVVTPWRADPVAGIVELYAGTPGVWQVECTGRPWPAALASAALDWAAHVYDTQRTTLNPADPDEQPLPSFGLPNRVAEFVAPYRVPGIA